MGYKLWYDIDRQMWQVINTKTQQVVAEAGDKASVEEELARLNK